MDLMGRIAQSPAMQQMAQGMAEQLDGGSTRGRHQRQQQRGAVGGASAADSTDANLGTALDFGSFAQQMLPLVSQVRWHCSMCCYAGCTSGCQ
jgi:hypothetical protein